MRNALIAIFFCVLGLLVTLQRPALAEEAYDDEISLAVGETATISADGVANYSEGTPNIVTIKLTTDKTSFVVAGQNPGSTTLLMIMKDGSQQSFLINVSSQALQVVEREVEELIKELPGVRKRKVGNRLFLEGGVVTENDKQRAEQIASLYPDQVQSLVIVGGAPADRNVQVRIDFFFVKYSRAHVFSFGVGWPITAKGDASLTYNLVNRSVTSSAATITGQALPSLDIAANNGWAKVLKQSTVICSNGEEASFDSGGAQNFPVSSGLTAAIQSIEFGTNLTVTPRYDSSTGNLNIKINATVSDLEAPTSSTLPSKSTARLKTAVDVKLGQSVILSGMNTRSELYGVSGLPLLSDIPLLGVLFGSHRNATEQTEGAIFIVPSVVESITPANADLLKRAFSQYAKFSGNMDKVRTYDRMPPSLKIREEE